MKKHNDSTKPNSRPFEFITFELWEEAHSILQQQIGLIEQNRHFSTLNLLYFAKTDEIAYQIKSEDYYQQFVQSGLFYAHINDGEFFLEKYPRAKFPSLGIRNYSFLSYPMTVLIYAFGLYLNRVTFDFQKKFVTGNPHIKAFYGGKLEFQEQKIDIAKTDLYYKKDYTQFRDTLRDEVNAEGYERKVVIKLDIKDYYDNISIARFIELVSNKNEEAKRVFDENREEIIFFYRFLGNGRDNNPQSDNNVISSLIGYLFLFFGDAKISSIVDRISKSLGIALQSHKIIRYIDDTFVVLEFAGEKAPHANSREDFLIKLIDTISGEIYDELSLSLNNKCEIWQFSNEEERKGFLQDVRYFNASEIDDWGDDEGEEKSHAGSSSLNLEDAAKIFYDRLLHLKTECNNDINNYFAPKDYSMIRGDLNHIFMKIKDKQTNEPKKVIDFLKSHSDRYLSKTIFEKDSDFKLLHFGIKQLIAFLNLDEEIQKRLHGYMEKTKDSIFGKELYIEQISQQGHKIEKTKLEEILQHLLKKDIAPLSRSCYSDKKKEIERMFHVSDMSGGSLYEQMRWCSYHERLGNYSTALNHLWNQIQLFCYWHDKKRTELIKEYSSKLVSEFLISIHFSKDIDKITQISKKRNHTSVSHPQSQNITPATTKEEYFKSKQAVQECMTFITQKAATVSDTEK